LDRLLEAAWGRTAALSAPGDRRFTADAWTILQFNLIKQAFLLTEEWWAAAVSAPAGTARANDRIVSFSARQWIDMFSPSNVPWLSHKVIDATVNTYGHNLLRGPVNWLDDVQEALGGPPASSGFVMGENLAATLGTVLLRNELMDLIQYVPHRSCAASQSLSCQRGHEILCPGSFAAQN
jgi:polyhydroxyalkanoate synthase